MDNIYITSFEQSKLNFAEFILNTFNNNKFLLSFSLSLIKKNMIIKGIKISDYQIFELSSISFNKNKNNNNNNKNKNNNYNLSNLSPLELGNVDLYFSCLQPCYQQEQSNDYYDLHKLSSKFSIIEQQIIYQIIIKKNLYLNQTEYPTHFSSNYYKFNKSTLLEDINYFIGEELITKQYTIQLFNNIKKNQYDNNLLRTKL